jgi:hypothetical protein
MLDFTKLFSQADTRNALAEWSRAWGGLGSKTAGGQDDDYVRYGRDLGFIVQAHGKQAMETAQRNAATNLQTWQQVMDSLMSPALPQQWWEYMVDSAQRSVLYTDAMRERGNTSWSTRKAATRRCSAGSIRWSWTVPSWRAP